jgi:hypothetical protein
MISEYQDKSGKGNIFIKTAENFYVLALPFVYALTLFQNLVFSI